MINQIEVTTSLGKIRGFVQDGSRQFRGIPYAEAPIGERRFMLPVTKKPWDGVLEATKFAPICAQNSNRVEAWIGTMKEERSEDCLSLNIFTPETEGPHAVMMWIHGGAWVSNGGAQELYNAAEFARRGNITVVTINYRLGPFGFLCYPGIIEPNIGFKDCCCALDWINEHIAAFGGDPRNITVAGQSAGGSMAYYLIADKQYRHKFQKAIPMSAPLALLPRPEQVATDMTETVFDALGITSREPAVVRSELLRKSSEELMNAGGVMAGTWMPRFAKDANRFWDVPWVPIDEKYSTVDVLMDDIVEGLVETKMPVLFGSVLNEYSFASRSHEFLSDRMVGRVEFEDYCYRAIELADAKAYAYFFTWGNKEQPGYACHCADLPVLFNTWDAHDGTVHQGTDSDEMKKLAFLMQDCWSSFIRTGTPAPVDQWPPYTAKGLVVRELDGQGNACFRRF